MTDRHPRGDVRFTPSELPFAQWFGAGVPASGSLAPRGVALLIHGLNFQPDGMRDIARLLSGWGIESLNVSLRGHGGNYDPEDDSLPPETLRLASFRTVSRPIWLGEAHRAYQVARRRASAVDAPLVLVGYSLGALIGVDLLCDPERMVSYDAMILFAPALKTRWFARALRGLSGFPRLVIPSFAPPCTVANRGTPIAAYNALFESIARLRRRPMAKANVPTLIFIDPKDELVSYRGLVALRDREGLDRWEIQRLKRPLARGEPDYHHLIVAKQRLGPEAWGRVSARIARFLECLEAEGTSAQASAAWTRGVRGPSSEESQ